MKPDPTFHLGDEFPRRLRLVLHGASCQSEPLRASVRALRDAGADLEVRVTYEAGDARRFAAHAAEDGRAVLAMGGDGTLHEVVNGLSDAAGDGDVAVALGVIPGGTGNDFASAAGIPVQDPAAALRHAVRSPRQAIDLVKVQIYDGGTEDGTDGEADVHRLLNVSTAGLGAEVTADAPESAKRWLGNLAYLLAGVQRARELEAQRISVTGVDAEGEEFRWQGRAFGIAVGNGRRAGGGARLCPLALLDDGLVDLVICPEMPFDQLLPVVGQTLVGDLLRRAESRDGPATEGDDLVYRQLRSVEIDCHRETPINLDGEPFHGHRFRFEVEPKRLPILLPSSCPLLGSA